MTSTVAFALLFASLGLVGLAVVLLAQRYSTTALAIALAGLLALTTVSAWLASGGLQSPNDGGVVGAGAASAQLAGDERQAADRIAGLERKVADGEAEIARLRAELDAARRSEGETRRRIDGLAAANARLERDLQASAEKLAAAGAALALREQSGAAGTGGPPPPAAAPRAPDTEQATAPARTVAVDRSGEAAGLASGGARIAPRDVRQRLAAPFGGPHYALEPLPVRELVAGLKGSWYVVRLRRDGEPLRFERRRFRNPAAARQLAASTRRFSEEILGPLAAVSRSRRLFVRGSADALGYAGRDELPDVGHSLTYLPLRPDGRHATTHRRQQASPVVRNRDLPNLRADWLRAQIGRELSPLAGGDIDILENPPAPSRDRTAELILFVAW